MVDACVDPIVTSARSASPLEMLYSDRIVELRVLQTTGSPSGWQTYDPVVNRREISALFATVGPLLSYTHLQGSEIGE